MRLAEFTRGSLCVLFSGALGVTCAPASAVVIDLVPVGLAGNPADTRHDAKGFGAVDYEYLIGKYEVTNAQYREFLNAKAAVGDPHSLYHPNMADVSNYGGIERVGSGTPEDPWIYIPKGGETSWDQKPVNFVGFFDAARFANWLHNGQGDGDTESGAYTGVGDEPNFRRLPGARFFIPTEDEWYKAAYFDPDKDGEPGYWEFPTRSNMKPDNAPAPGNSTQNGSANFSGDGPVPVGSFSSKPSVSGWGTYDQGGNLWEWNETFIFVDYFGLRGGSFENTYGMEAEHQYSYPEFFQNRMIGFRVAASVPEPGVLAALACVGGGFMLRRRR